MTASRISPPILQLACEQNRRETFSQKLNSTSPSRLEWKCPSDKTERSK
jgi:hypothetical protein